jgi:hypothetical protein
MNDLQTKKSIYLPNVIICLNKLCDKNTEYKISSNSWNVCLGYKAKHVWYTKYKLICEDLVIAKAKIPRELGKPTWK